MSQRPLPIRIALLAVFLVPVGFGAIYWLSSPAGLSPVAPLEQAAPATSAVVSTLLESGRDPIATENSATSGELPPDETVGRSDTDDTKSPIAIAEAPAGATASGPIERTDSEPLLGRVQPQTSCEALTHIGDSTSVGLIAAAVLPDESDRVDARYRTVGVERADTDIAGAISIIETIPGEPNAEDRVLTWTEADPERCWVLALGTNDAANMSIGGASTAAGRIDRIMEHLDGHPALWTTVRTLVSRGPYADKEMAAWNEALVEACTRHPNMAVYDWAAEVDDDWYLPDGIHFTSEGYRERGRRLATSLAIGFPDETERPENCVVGSE